jgi:hypothetical protein
MTVRAKFKVQSITETKHWQADKGNMFTIQMNPVSSGSEENKSFFEATPSGEIKMTVTNGVGKLFPVGSEFYVDFTPAE